MRVYATYDQEGRILALAEIVDGEERIQVRLRPEEDQQVVELDVPEGFEERPFSELAERYRVDTGGSGEPRFAPR